MHQYRNTGQFLLPLKRYGFALLPIKGLTANLVIFSCSFWLALHPNLQATWLRLAAWEQKLKEISPPKYLGGGMIFLCIAAVILLVQEVEKRRS